MISCKSGAIFRSTILDDQHRPKRVHEAIVDPSSGRRFTSITMIPESGHLVSTKYERTELRRSENNPRYHKSNPINWEK